MLSKICFFTLLATVAAKTSWKDLDNYSFEQFTKEFGLKFDSSEVDNRRSLFVSELARVRSHNAKNLSWKEGVNKFSAMSAAEKRNYHGISKNAGKQYKSLKHLKSLPNDFSNVNIDSLPKSVDWRKHGIVSAVKDQGHCGSCWSL
jgi:C1A family cysteine protease